MELKLIPLSLITPNPSQPREQFDKESLQELADSMTEANMVQPIVVRKHGNNYQIIAGERRWRSAQLAGLKEIPAIIKEVPDDRVLIESLIENLHRKDLDDIERENAIYTLWKSGKFQTMAQLAKSLGVTGTRVSSDIEAKEFRREFSVDRQISTEAIRASRGLSDQERKRVIDKVSKGELGVREVWTVTKVLKNAPESIKEAVLDGSIKPELAEEIAEIKQPEIRNQAIEIAKKGVYSPIGLRTIIDRLENPRIELPSLTLGEQIFNKTKWNLERIGAFDFYTVGYENKSLTQLIALLHCKNVRTLLDVRKNPVSMYKMEFNKDNLRSELPKNSIDYVHLPLLGVPSEIREKLSVTHDYQWFFDWYDTNVLSSEAFKSLELKNFKSSLAIMCVEFDPTRCHRHRLALALEKRGLKGYDL